MPDAISPMGQNPFIQPFQEKKENTIFIPPGPNELAPPKTINIIKPADVNLCNLHLGVHSSASFNAEFLLALIGVLNNEKK